MSGLNLNDISAFFLSLIFEGLPFIFVGTLASGFIDAYLPPGLMERWLPRRRFLAILLGGLLGMVFPVCECAIVPVIGRLIRKGLPISCAITYMLAAPIINPITAVSTLSAFSAGHPWLITGSRFGLAYLVTVLVGVLVASISAERVLKPKVWNDLKQGKADDHAHAPPGGSKLTQGKADDHAHAPPGGSKLTQALRTAMRDCVDTGMFFIIGVAVTAIFNALPIQQTVAEVFSRHVLLGIGGMMLLAFILSLCSTSDAFIAATLKVTFPTASAEYAARLAFLTFGPMMDVKLLFMYASVFRGKFIAGLFLGLFLLIGLMCWAWSFLPLAPVTLK